ncbi:MAG TPA: HEPN domain-containing protein [Aquiluna sp.]
MPKALSRINLTLAEEFLAVAQFALDSGFYNAAGTNAVTSAIRAKDAYAIEFAGQSQKSSDHGRAISELNRIGREGPSLSRSLEKILKEKNRFQYQDVFSAQESARVQVKRAESFLLAIRATLAV